MVEARSVEERVAPLAARIAEREGCELVDCEYVHLSGRWHLRIYIDHPEGVNIDDCGAVSKQLSALLDVEDLIPHAYTLEVSSPGLNRRLNKPGDYLRYAGEQVRVKTTSPIRGRRRFRGVLEKLENDVVTIQIDGGQQFEIPLSKVANARLDPRL